MKQGRHGLVFGTPAVTVAAAILGGLLGNSSAAVANSAFDGSWSVLIVTDHGTCDRAYRYALRIVDGRIVYTDPSFNVTGHVDAHGRVAVRLSYGQQQASGSGRLAGDQGTGRWSGRSSTSECSGHWEAERRGN